MPQATLRRPVLADAPAMWRLVRESGRLDANSAYAYMLLCRFFSDTCFVASAGSRLLGMVTAFYPPHQPETIFVWQVAVSPAERGRGLGRRLVTALARDAAQSGARFLEATVTPSNAASDRLFRRLAAELECPCRVSTGFPDWLFPESRHEPELLYRIGPFALGPGDAAAAGHTRRAGARPPATQEATARAAGSAGRPAARVT